MAKKLQFRCLLSHTYHRMWKETEKNFLTLSCMIENGHTLKVLWGEHHRIMVLTVL